MNMRYLNPVWDGGLLVDSVLTESTGWSDTVKTSHAKELPPQSIDWYTLPSRTHPQVTS